MGKIFRNARDPISSETHFIGACLSFIGLIYILFEGIYYSLSSPVYIGSIIFGVSLIALYSASSIYHFFKGGQKIKTILRKLDHSMIYVLIVGTYTPVVLYCMDAPKSYYFLTVLWLIAGLGIIVKLFWLNAPRAIATLFYLVLGWAIVFDFNSFRSISSMCLTTIAAGGICYSVGALIYIFKKPNISKEFGFHEIFHIFVMLGSFLHYIAIVGLLL